MPVETSDVSDFIQTLYNIVSNPKHAHAVEWARGGDEVIINDETAFTNDILHRYFRASSFASFVRQLNLYGFSKRGIRFTHAHFLRDHPEQLYLVRRKLTGNQPATNVPQKKKSNNAHRRNQTGEPKASSRQSTRIQDQGPRTAVYEGATSDSYDYSGEEDGEYVYSDDQTQQQQPPEPDQYLQQPYHQQYQPTAQDSYSAQPILQPGIHDTNPKYIHEDKPDDDIPMVSYPFEFDEEELADNTTNTNNALIIPLDTSIDSMTQYHSQMPGLNPVNNNINNVNVSNKIHNQTTTTTTPNPNTIVSLPISNNYDAYSNPRYTQTIPITQNGPSYVSVEQYNETVSQLEDQVELLTQQYQLLYQSQFHILSLLSHYFGRDMSGFAAAGGGNTGADLMTLDPAMVELAARGEKGMYTGPSTNPLHNQQNANITAFEQVSNAAVIDMDAKNSKKNTNNDFSNYSMNNNNTNNNNNFSNTNYTTTPALPQPGFGVQISIETPVPTPIPQQHGGNSSRSAGGLTGDSSTTGGRMTGNETPALLPHDLEQFDPTNLPSTTMNFGTGTTPVVVNDVFADVLEPIPTNPNAAVLMQHTNNNTQRPQPVTPQMDPLGMGGNNIPPF